MAIVDFYDALMHRQTGKSQWSKKRALDEISKLSNTRFNPKIVSAFISELTVGEET